jgi:hypothetical protein
MGLNPGAAIAKNVGRYEAPGLALRNWHIKADLPACNISTCCTPAMVDVVDRAALHFIRAKIRKANEMPGSIGVMMSRPDSGLVSGLRV